MNRARIWRHAIAAALALVLFAQLLLSARSKSATMDEQNHIARGLVYLRTGDLRLSTEHPPLINLACALPLWFDETISLPLKGSAWHRADFESFAEEFLWRANYDGPSIVARARLPIMALAVLLALLVYVWASELYGPGAGLLALSLLVFDPNILAHGGLATNDLGLAFFVALSAYAVWRLLRRPTLARAALAGAAVGLTLASKFSACFLLAALPVFALIDWLSRPAEARPALEWKPVLKAVVFGGLAAGLTVWAVYGFQVGHSEALGFTIPASSYADGLRSITLRLAKASPAFLMGEYSTEGWWYYFPVAFAVKTPLPLLLLFGLTYLWARRAGAWRDGMPLLALSAIYFVISLASPLNIGYRHLLPLLPFLFILASGIGSVPWRQKAGAAWATAILLGWLIARTLSIHPHYLAYFNEIAGGPGGGHRVLVDSNLDWGQDLPGLRAYMAREKIDSVKLSYFGTAYPEAYGIQYEPLPSFPRNFAPSGDLANPAPGVYAISATNLQGALFPDHSLYSWFRARKPDAVIGYSIFIYRVR